MNAVNLFAGTKAPARPRWDHAVVIGGGFAGLISSRVLADYFHRVTIIERDRLPDGPEARHGTPQARHVHGLLGRGQAILERVFPGILDELGARSAERLDIGADIA